MDLIYPAADLGEVLGGLPPLAAFFGLPIFLERFSGAHIEHPVSICSLQLKIFLWDGIPFSSFQLVLNGIEYCGMDDSNLRSVSEDCPAECQCQSISLDWRSTCTF